MCILQTVDQILLCLKIRKSRHNSKSFAWKLRNSKFWDWPSWNCSHLSMRRTQKSWACWCEVILKKFAVIGQSFYLVLPGSPYHIETSPLTWFANQRTDFSMIGTSVIKELNKSNEILSKDMGDYPSHPYTLGEFSVC